MTSGRAGVFDDLSDFAPAPPAAGAPAEEVKAVAEGAAFRSREPGSVPAAAPVPPPVTPPARREPRRYRTGRNVTVSVKTTQETVDAFYELARSQGWKAGETFEQAIQALQEKLARGGRSG